MCESTLDVSETKDLGISKKARINQTIILKLNQESILSMTPKAYREESKGTFYLNGTNSISEIIEKLIEVNCDLMRQSCSKANCILKK